MSIISKTLSGLTAAALLMTTVPVWVSAVEPEGEPVRIRVIVENKTLSAENGAAWTDVLLDDWIEADSDATAESVFLQALEKHDYTQQGAEYGYITAINGLSAEDGGSMGGWMMSLDDWFTDEGISAYSVASGKLENGDELRFSYSCAWGADLDYDWMGADTSLAGVVFSTGTLEPAFAEDTYEYVMTLPEETSSLTVRPVVKNKAYRAKVYRNTYTPAAAGTDYKPSQEIPVVNGDVITVGVANEAWMQANYNNAQESIYRFHVNVPEKTTDPAVEETESMIDAIGTVGSSSGKAIANARKSYDRLSPEQQKSVSNYEVLTAAETAFAALNVGAAVSLEELRTACGKQADKDCGFGNEWDILNLARFDLMTDSIRTRYLDSVGEAVKASGGEALSATRATVNAGVIAALTALGENPADFCGCNLLQPLSDLDYVTKQGVNGAIYTLIALDTKKYDIPAAKEGTQQTTREKLVTAILSEQQSDGGWTIDTWSGTNDGSDADLTAMALQALAPYRSDVDVQTAIDKALTFLSDQQNEDGLFRSYGSYDCESSAQVLTALCALRISAEDTRFTKNGYTVYDALTRFYDEKALSFSHFEDGEPNVLSTTQAFTAAAALYRLRNGQTAYFDMTDIPFRSSEEVTDSSVPDREQSDAVSGKLTPSADDASVRTGDTDFCGVWITLVLSAGVVFILFKNKKRFDTFSHR